MLRLFSLFGRSADLNALDDALRAAGVQSMLVPEAVKLTVLRLHRRDGSAGQRTETHAYAADLLAYCILGRAAFVEANDISAADRAERRIDAAIDAGTSLDARLILLALHAGLIAPDIADRLEIAES